MRIETNEYQPPSGSSGQLRYSTTTFEPVNEEIKVIGNAARWPLKIRPLVFSDAIFLIMPNVGEDHWCKAELGVLLYANPAMTLGKKLIHLGSSTLKPSLYGRKITL